MLVDFINGLLQFVTRAESFQLGISYKGNARKITMDCDFHSIVFAAVGFLVDPVATMKAYGGVEV